MYIWPLKLTAKFFAHERRPKLPQKGSQKGRTLAVSFREITTVPGFEFYGSNFSIQFSCHNFMWHMLLGWIEPKHTPAIFHFLGENSKISGSTFKARGTFFACISFIFLPMFGIYTPPNTNSSHLKHWGWKMSFLLGPGPRGRCDLLVLGSVSHRDPWDWNIYRFFDYKDIQR